MNSKVLQILALFTLALLSSSAFATVIQTCELSGRIDLKENTNFQCATPGKDFYIAPNTLIITHGHELTLFTLNNLNLNNLNIRSFEEDRSAQSQDAASISVTALTCEGGLNINNEGLGEEGQSSDVSIKCYSTTQSFLKSLRVVLDASEATFSLQSENNG